MMARVQRERWARYHRGRVFLDRCELALFGLGAFSVAVGVMLLAARWIGGVR